MLHQLTLSNIYLHSIKTMDRLIMSFVKRWLRLPTGTSLGLFYVPYGIGGLSITRLFLTITIMRLRRINSIRGNDDRIIQTFPHNIILKRPSPRYYDNIYFSNNINIKQYHNVLLFRRIDEVYCKVLMFPILITGINH